MPDSVAPSPTTSLETAVARSAEAALDKVAAARAAIGTTIFGQEKVVEETLVTLLAGGHGLLVGRARPPPRPSSSTRWASCSASTRAASSSRPT